MTAVKPNWFLPPRFLVFVVTAAISGVVASLVWGRARGWLLGVDVASVLFLLSVVPLLSRCSPVEMRRRAARNSANRSVMLILSAIITPTVLGALGIEITDKHAPAIVVVYVVSTLVLTWSFIHAAFALHYAHMYYDQGDDSNDIGGIIFPETPEPNYWDFIYFSYCLGMTFQTSDSNISSRAIRRVVTLQCLLSFVFSVGIIAFTISFLGGK